ncbi:MAG: nitroreductase family protein [Candidatus Methanomethylophilaceae archaeon]|nr:nitroreductase family protein [Candidatus Methanomethylophilaceae archaeon]
MDLMQLLDERRSEYSLGSDTGVDPSVVEGNLRRVVRNLPSPYNSQPSRAVLVTGEDHRVLWEIVRSTLHARMGDGDRFDTTSRKVDGFSAAAGTVMFFIVDGVTDDLIARYPSYSGTFPVWAEQACAMMQFAVWIALRDMGLGANLQHYNPLIDAEVHRVFGIPAGWRLVSQMPFGRIVEPAGPLEKLPPEDVLVTVHAVGSNL